MGKGKQASASKTSSKATTTGGGKSGGGASSTVAQLQGVLSGKKESRSSLGGKGTGAYGASLSKSKQR